MGSVHKCFFRESLSLSLSLSFLTLILFIYSDWMEGMVTEYLVATFADYFGDVKQ